MVSITFREIKSFGLRTFQIEFNLLLIKTIRERPKEETLGTSRRTTNGNE